MPFSRIVPSGRVGRWRVQLNGTLDGARRGKGKADLGVAVVRGRQLAAHRPDEIRGSQGQHVGPDVRQDPDAEVVVPGLDGVCEGVCCLTTVQVVGGLAMQRGRHTRASPGGDAAAVRGKQRVPPVAGLRPDRGRAGEKQPAHDALLEQLRAARNQVFRQAGGDPVGHRCAENEVGHLRLELAEDLFDEVLVDGHVEGADEAKLGRVVDAVAQRHEGQAHRNRPAVGEGAQLLGGSQVHPLVHSRRQRADFLGGKGQGSLAQLTELTLQAQLVHRERRRVVPADQDQPGRVRGEPHERAEDLSHGCGSQLVHVVEDHDQARRRVGETGLQLVDSLPSRAHLAGGPQA